MKIKTVWRLIDESFQFDEIVNSYLDKGWRLAKREVLDGKALSDNRYQRRMLYAELVLPDEPEEQELQVPLTPLDALQFIQNTCTATSDKDCQFACPLRPWCNQLRDGGDPTDWDLSQLEADA